MSINKEIFYFFSFKRHADNIGDIQQGQLAFLREGGSMDIFMAALVRFLKPHLN